MDLYCDDLAYIHHVGFSDFIGYAAPNLLNLLRQAGISEGRVIDIGCGGGLWLGKLLNAGYEAMGADISPAFVAIAKQVAPQATIQTTSWDTMTLPPCDAVTALGEVLCYMRGPAQEHQLALRRFFGTVFQALRPGGILCFDALVEDRDNPMTYQTWRSGEDWAVLVAVSENPDQRVVVRDITTFRKINDHYRRNQHQHRLLVVSPSEIKQALEESGYSVKMSRHYGQFELPFRRMAFTAVKPRE